MSHVRRALSLFSGAKSLYGVHTVPPNPFSGDDSTYIPQPNVSAMLALVGQSVPVQTSPVVNVDDFGAIGNGIVDDTVAIKAAIASLPATGGATLVFTSGKTYIKTDYLIINNPDIIVWGVGAKLYSIGTDAQWLNQGSLHLCIWLQGARCIVYELYCATNLRARPAPNSVLAGVWLNGPSQKVIGGRFDYFNWGVFANGAGNYTIAANVVYRTVADSIGNQGSPCGGAIVGNAIRQGGDDGISVTMYVSGPPNTQPIYIINNDIAQQYWGRGLSVVGGTGVTIRNNKIDRTPYAAGIYIYAESGFNPDTNILVADNTITNIEMPGLAVPPIYWPDGQKQNITMHGAILTGSANADGADGIVLVNNTVTTCAYDGLQFQTGACNCTQIGTNLITGWGFISGAQVDNAVTGCPITLLSDPTGPVASAIAVAQPALFGASGTGTMSGPASLPNLAAWWADSMHYSDHAPFNLKTWIDVTGQGNDLLQLTPSEQPTWTLALLNGYPGLQTDGVSTFVGGGSTAGFPRTLFLVVRVTSPGVSGPVNAPGPPGNDVMVDSNTAVTHSPGAQVRVDNTPEYVLNAGSNLTVAGNPFTTFKVLCAVWNGSSSQLWVNGTMTASGSDGAQAETISGVRVGASANGAGTRQLAVDATEGILYTDAKGSTDIGTITTYLRTKYSI